MSKNRIVKKLTIVGEVVNLKLYPNINEKYQTLEFYKKCEICGKYYEEDLGCFCLFRQPNTNRNKCL